MAKAVKKEVVEEVKDVPIPEGIQIKDLSPEKRMELYQQEVGKFDTEMSKTYGISISAELKFTPRGIIPGIVLVDLLAKKNNGNPQQAPKKENPAA